jgi:hypothetical protein
MIKTYLIVFALGLTCGFCLTAALHRQYVVAIEDMQSQNKRLEASKLITEDLVVAHQAAANSLLKALIAAKNESSDFQMAFDAAQKRLEGVKPVFIIQGATKECKIDPKAKAVESKPIDKAQAQAPSETKREFRENCVLTTDDFGFIKLTITELRTEAGNGVLIGSAEAWRSKPLAKLFSSPIESKFTDIAEAEPTPKLVYRAPSWAIGPLVGLDNRGLIFGGAIETPQIDLLLGFKARGLFSLTKSTESVTGIGGLLFSR